MSVSLDNIFSRMDHSSPISSSIPLLEPLKRICTAQSYTSEAIAIDSRYIITPGPGDSILIWDRDGHSVIHSLLGHVHDDPVSYIKMSGDRLVTYANAAGFGASIKIWDMQRGVLLNTIPTWKYFTVEGNHLIQWYDGWSSNQNERQGKIWNLDDGQLLCSLGDPLYSDVSESEHLQSFSCHPIVVGDYVVTGHRNGSVNVWNKNNGDYITTLAAGQDEDERSIISLQVDDESIIWNNGYELFRAPKTFDKSRIQIFAHYKRIVVSDDLLIGKLILDGKHCLHAQHKESGAFLYSRDCEGKFIVEGNRLVLHHPSQKKILVLDKRDGSFFFSIDCDNSMYLKFEIFGNLLIITPYEENIQIWSLESGNLLFTLKGRSPYAREGSRLITSSEEDLTEMLVYDLSSL